VSRAQHLRLGPAANVHHGRHVTANAALSFMYDNSRDVILHPGSHVTANATLPTCTAGHHNSPPCTSGILQRLSVEQATSRSTARRPTRACTPLKAQSAAGTSLQRTSSHTGLPSVPSTRRSEWQTGSVARGSTQRNSGSWIWMQSCRRSRCRGRLGCRAHKGGGTGLSSSSCSNRARSSRRRGL
jgi:hypothetical protein